MKKIILVVTAVIFLASCEKNTAPSSSNQSDSDVKTYSEIAAKAAIDLFKTEKINKNGDDKNKEDKNEKSETKKIKITGSGNINYVLNGCGNGTLQFQSSGSATSTFLGSISQKTSFCIDSATGQAMGAITGTATTHNGDKLYYSLTGMGIDPATGLTYQDYSFTGGTGKYAGATGSMTLVYDVFTPATFHYDGTGSITIF